MIDTNIAKKDSQTYWNYNPALLHSSSDGRRKPFWNPFSQQFKNSYYYIGKLGPPDCMKKNKLS